jgi:hypothetical protein
MAIPPDGLGFTPSDPLQALFAEAASSGGDGSRLLLELDNGLRSSSTETKINALVQFPRLFELFPYPHTITAAVIRLAELFRQEYAMG